MGYLKHKWTAEEATALRAAVAKHGIGKWRKIQKDPEFRDVLYLRSNVDIKDKWRNMSVRANKRMRKAPKEEGNRMALTEVDVLAVSSGSAQIGNITDTD